MTETNHPVAPYLEHPFSAIEAFDAELQAGLPPDVFNHLVEWINVNAPAATRPIWDVVEFRTQRIAVRESQVSENETKEEAQQRIRAYFEDINPAPIASSLQAACRFQPVIYAYEQTLSTLGNTDQIGPIVRRYHLPTEAVSSLLANCTAPLRPALEALGAHAVQLKAHGDLLTSLAGGKGLRAGLGIAASIAGGAFLGPLGAIGARLLTSSAMNPAAKIEASNERVAASFEAFRAAFVSAMQVVDANVRYTLVSLYGGFLLRLERDLNALGRGLVGIDLTAGYAYIGLSPEALNEYDAWARTSLTQMRSLREQYQWVRLGDAADKALRFTLADPFRSDIIGGGFSAPYSLEFARMRAAALNVVAHAAWSQGKIDEACTIYRHLLSGTNVAWERSIEGEQTPADEALHIAGLRLAIAATRSDHGEMNLDDLAALPTFVAQATARFAGDEPWLSIPGEGISAATIAAATTIATYANERGIDLRLAERMSEAVNRNGGLAQWESLVETCRDEDPCLVLELVDEQTREAYDEASDFLKWFVGKAEQHDKRVRLIAYATLTTVGGAVSVAGYYLFKWLFF